MAPPTLVAFTPRGILDEAYFVGSYFWYSIEEAMRPLDRVRKAFTDNGLDAEWLPKERRPEHRMQEACRKVERVTSNGHREEIRAEQVDRDREKLVYQITRHVQHRETLTIEHPKALRVTFSFGAGTLTFEPLDGATRREVGDLIAEIEQHFAESGSKIPGRKLRTIVRHYIEAAGAENMRGASGGVYFMPKENPIPTWNRCHSFHGALIDGADFIQRVRMMLEDVYGTAPNFHAIPCINDEGQREFLKRRFVENCTRDLEEYRNECIELVRDKSKRERGFRTDKIEAMSRRRRDIDSRRQKFAEILGETLEELNTNMALADQALRKFLDEAGS